MSATSDSHKRLHVSNVYRDEAIGLNLDLSTVRVSSKSCAGLSVRIVVSLLLSDERIVRTVRIEGRDGLEATLTHDANVVGS